MVRLCEPGTRHSRRNTARGRAGHARKRATWAELLKRVFEIDVLVCPWCGGKRNLIALITDGAVVRRILEHLGLPTSAPTLAPARSPPELELAG